MGENENIESTPYSTVLLRNFVLSYEVSIQEFACHVCSCFPDDAHQNFTPPALSRLRQVPATGKIPAAIGHAPLTRKKDPPTPDHPPSHCRGLDRFSAQNKTASQKEHSSRHHHPPDFSPQSFPHTASLHKGQLAAFLAFFDLLEPFGTNFPTLRATSTSTKLGGRSLGRAKGQNGDGRAAECSHRYGAAYEAHFADYGMAVNSESPGLGFC